MLTEIILAEFFICYAVGQSFLSDNSHVAYILNAFHKLNRYIGDIGD